MNRNILFTNPFVLLCLTRAMTVDRVLVLQHVPWEGPGLIGQALAARGFSLDVRTVVDQAQPQLPALDELRAVVIMGGPMAADDTANYPGLAAEAQLVRDAIAVDLPVLGVCLGHQIIAVALGAQLEPGVAPEFGMCAIEVTQADPLIDPLRSAARVLQWHSDYAHLPEGATLLARSEVCPNQAFRFGSAVGMQFHVELDSAELANWLETPGVREELPDEVATTIEADLADDLPSLAPAASQCLQAFAASL